MELIDGHSAAGGLVFTFETTVQNTEAKGWCTDPDQRRDFNAEGEVA